MTGDQGTRGRVSVVTPVYNGAAYVGRLLESVLAQTWPQVEMILSERETEAYNAWYDSLKEAAEITTNEELIGTLSFERNFMPPSEEEEPSGEETPEEEELSGEEMPGEGEPSEE